MFFSDYEEQKIYIIGNNIWKNEILKYIETKSILDYKKYNKILDNDNFIIRIYTIGWNKTEQVYIGKMISGPNKAEIYSFIKSRDLPFVKQNYKYLIEIEKRYKKNIKNTKFNKVSILDFLNQLLYCQMNLFVHHGLVHNNIHEGNIFIEDKNDDILYHHINKTIKTQKYYILSDFTKSKIYKPSKFSSVTEEKIYDESILKNLEDIVKLAFKLSDVKLNINIHVSDEIKKEYIILITSYIKNNNEYTTEDYKKYLEYDSNYKYFNKQTLNLCWQYINPILSSVECNIE